MKLFNVKKIAVASALVAGGLISVNANAAITFTDLGAAPVGAPYAFYRMSADGSILTTTPIGLNSSWVNSSTPSTLNTTNGVYYYGLSGDGSILVGSSNMSTPTVFLRSGSSTIAVTLSGSSSNSANAVSYDGTVIVHSSSTAPGYWDNPVGSGANISYTYHALQMPTSNVYVNFHSTNNATTVGNYYPSGGQPIYTDWTPFALDLASGTYSTLQLGSGYTGGTASAISNNGLVIIGNEYPSNYSAGSPTTNPAAAIVWQRGNTSSSFGAPTQLLTYTDSLLNAVSGLSQTTGAYAVGRTTVATNFMPVIWRISDGYFANLGGLTGYASNATMNVSADGRYVLGYATGVGGHGWLADLGANQSNVTWLAPNTYSYAQAPQSNSNNSTPAIDVTNTNTSLANSAYQLNSVLNAQNMLLTMGLRNYDCQEFGENGYCAAVGGFSSIISSTRTRDTGLNLRVAKKVTDSVRVGLYLDQSWNDTLPSDFDINHSNPLVGAFVGYNENSDGTGLNAKLTASFGEMKASNTRNTTGLSNTEAGTGSSHFRSSGGQFELGYGKQLNDNWQAQPFFGARYVTVKRNGYTETDSVNFPVTYSSVRQSEFTGFIGVKLNGQLNEKVVLRANLIAEHGLSNHISDYVGTYADGNAGIALSSSSLPEIKRNRIVASAGADYVIDQRQRVSLMLSEQPLNVGTHLSAMATYMIGF